MKASFTLLYAGISALLLTGCGGTNVSAPFAPAPSRTPIPKPVHKVFEYTGQPQKFVVPSGVNSLTINAKGAGGAATGPAIGLGAAIKATIAVTPGETLAVYVGGKGTSRAGGYNGGGSPGLGGNAGGGGGASDVRQGGNTLRSRVVIAGGGGGPGAGVYDTSYSEPGGTGGNGGKVGHAGGFGGSGSYGQNGGGGRGGSRAAGGSGGKGGFCSICYVKHDSRAKRDSYGGCDGDGGSAGKLGSGGFGGAYCDEPGGGGGGGYYGGGGGGSSAYSWVYEYPSGYSYSYGAGGGGGGGSSYAETSAVDVTYHPGVRSGNGEVVISTP